MKAGVKTSEWYLALIGTLVPVLNHVLGINLSPEEVVSISGIIIAYIGSRGYIKANS